MCRALGSAPRSNAPALAPLGAAVWPPQRVTQTFLEYDGIPTHAAQAVYLLDGRTLGRGPDGFQAFVTEAYALPRGSVVDVTWPGAGGVPVSSEPAAFYNPPFDVSEPGLTSLPADRGNAPHAVLLTVGKLKCPAFRTQKRVAAVRCG